jgi:iron uptake system component EfeO
MRHQRWLVLLGNVVLLSSLLCPRVSAAPQYQGAVTMVQVTLTDESCTPSVDSVPAGPVTFTIQNVGGERVAEVELFRGSFIIGERENLTAGRSGSFSVNLVPGEYELFCPGAAQERTRFSVVAPAGGASSGPMMNPVIVAAFNEASNAYRAYVRQEVELLVASTQEFTDAVVAGNLDQAMALYPRARYHWETIEPVAESFGDLDAAVDMREDDADEPDEFTGFHRLEKAIWEDRNLTGMTPIAQQLLADIRRLHALVNAPTFGLDAAQIANGASELLDEVAQSKVTGEEERYSKLDLLDMAANVEGSRKAFELLRPGLSMIDSALASEISRRFDAMDATLAPHRRGEGWVSYDALSADQVRALSVAVNDLAEPLSTVAALVVAYTEGDSGD